MSELNITPVHIVGAISIEAKQLAVLIDTTASRGGTIDIEAIKGSINRMVGLANAVQAQSTPEPAPIAHEGE